ncbi:MAG: GNAT family N-acetyltransferase [Acidobacteriota bacterium]
MAVLQTILNFFGPAVPEETGATEPAPPSDYSIHPLTSANLEEVIRLNNRCFRNGENYTKHTFNYLLSEPGTLSYRIVDDHGNMAGFIFVMITNEGCGHVTTIGVAPEHRRRALAQRLLAHMESALIEKGVTAAMLECRVSNLDAQRVYSKAGYVIAQKIANYYNNGEDGILMMKSLFR